MINWLNDKAIEGTASLYDTNITLNTVTSKWLNDAYRVMVGIDVANNDIIIAPINKDRYDKKDLSDNQLQKIAIKSTYSRISSSSLMKNIANQTGLALSNTPKKFPSIWDEKIGAVRIIIKEGGQQ